MVSFTRSAIENENISSNAEAQKRILGYAIALERVNDSRSKFWRIIHPFRNNAEQRDAALMREMLLKAIGDNAYRKAEDAAFKNVPTYTAEMENLTSSIESYNLGDNNDYSVDNDDNSLELDDDVSELGNDSYIDQDLASENDDLERSQIEWKEDSPFISIDDEKRVEYDKKRLEEFKKANEQYLNYKK